MRAALALVAVLVLLAGCRDYIVDLPPPQATPTSETRSLYVKGPRAELASGAVAELRGEPVTEVARYRWRFSGTGSLVTTTGTEGRVIDVRGGRVGTVVAALSGLDASGEQIAYGEVTFEVVR